MSVTELDTGRPYPKESELADRLEKLCHEYDGELSVVAVIGALELVKLEIARQEVD